MVWLISPLELSPRSLGNLLTTVQKVRRISIHFFLFTRILKNGKTVDLDYTGCPKKGQCFSVLGDTLYVVTDRGIITFFFLHSILEKFFTEVRYHPLLENFPEYPSLNTREPGYYDPNEKFSFGTTMNSGRVLIIWIVPSI